MTPRNKIITPAEALARASVRPRHAPRANVSAGLGGWLRWSLINREGREVAGGEQHNLMLNGFLDFIANNGDSGGIFGNTATILSPHFTFSHTAVGTGSTEPAVTDTALANEIARTSDLLSGSTSETQTANGEYEMTWGREFDFGEANGNLTEWGIAAGSASSILIRELFRDEGGEPITVTKTSDEKLRLFYTLEASLSPVTLTSASFDITNIGTINGQYMWIGGPSAGKIDLATFARIAAGLVTTNGTSTPSGDAVAAVRDTTSWSYSSNVNWGATLRADSVTMGSYTGGSYTRKVDEVQWSTSVGNITIATMGIGVGNSSAGNRLFGLIFLIDSGDRFAKDDLHQLTMTDYFSVSWDRA